DKGVGAALFMGLFRSLLRVFAGSVPGVVLEKYNTAELEKIAQGLENVDPAIKAVTLTNNYIAQNHGELNMFATLFFGLLDPKTGVLTYINGGHEAPVIIRVDGTQERIKATGPVVGPIDGIKFKIKQVELQPGDTLVSFTDGVTDARDPDGAFFTEKRVVALLKEAKETLAILDSESVISYLVNEIESHVADANPFDDITMLSIHRTSELDK
ncbi:MAG TPA: PP2C family protein-serine/threonine phosphatase, partial [Allocoleopsis sp.]